MQIWRNISLRTKIAGLFSFLTVSAVFTLTVISIQLEREYFRKDLENQADLLLETTSLSLRDPLYRLQLDELSDLSRALSDNADVVFFITYDSQGRVLTDSRNAALEFSREPDPLGVRLIRQSSGITYKEWQTDQLISGRPVTLGNQVIGAIATSLSTRTLEEKIANITLESILLAILTGLASILFGFWLARQITIPLSELTHSAAEMSRGNLKVQVQSDTNDETGQLARAFNLMAEAIHTREQALRDLAAGLEQTVQERTATLRQQADMLEEMAITDPLTRVYNRWHFFSLAEKEMEKTLRTRRPLSVILIDADHFKRINDTYGHPLGDQVLLRLTRIIQSNIRAMDIFARYGGEEFVLLMPETGAQAAVSTAERLRKIASDVIRIENGPEVRFSISLGIACWDGKPDTNLDTLISRADQALYESKRRGRNQSTCWETWQAGQ